MDTTTSASVTIYRKTAKGHAEIETRAHRLSLRLRSVLIMIDGRQPERELRKLAGEGFDARVLELLDGGFVEAIPVATEPRAHAARPLPPVSPGLAPLTPTTAKAPEHAAPPAAAPEAPAALPPTDIATLRREAVRTLTDQIGPMAETLAIKMEKARTWAELKPLLIIGREMLANTRGSAAAQAWQQRFIGP
jgi:hypothetical protein